MAAKNKTDLKNNKFDYFYVLLKNWKTIFVVCLIAFGISLLYIVIKPKTYFSKSTFSISLPGAYETNYGGYHFKTTNPLHYLSFLKQQKFKDSVLKEVGDENINNLKFTIAEETLIQDAKSSKHYYPNKFDFIVSGSQETAINKINETALSMFLENMDDVISNDMYNQLSSDLGVDIDSLRMAIQIKEKLIIDLKESLEDGVQIQTNKTDFKDLIDDRLINNLDGSERGLIISMMLSGNDGSQHYQKTVLAVEEVQLKVLKNNLEKKEVLLSRLVESEENEMLTSLFNRPFSSNFLSLASPENIKTGHFLKILKIVIGTVVLSFLVITFIILMRAYVAIKYS